MRVDLNRLLPCGEAEGITVIVGGLTNVGRIRGNIDEPRDLWIVARFGDDRSAPGVADKDYRPILQSNHALCGADIIGERGQRVLYCDHVKTACLQDGDNFAPTGA